jgi:hypothetical protein
MKNRTHELEEKLREENERWSSTMNLSGHKLDEVRQKNDSLSQQKLQLQEQGSDQKIHNELPEKESSTVNIMDQQIKEYQVPALDIKLIIKTVKNVIQYGELSNGDEKIVQYLNDLDLMKSLKTVIELKKSYQVLLKQHEEQNSNVDKAPNYIDPELDMMVFKGSVTSAEVNLHKDAEKDMLFQRDQLKMQLDYLTVEYKEYQVKTQQEINHYKVLYKDLVTTIKKDKVSSIYSTDSYVYMKMWF